MSKRNIKNKYSVENDILYYNKLEKSDSTDNSEKLKTYVIPKKIEIENSRNVPW